MSAVFLGVLAVGDSGTRGDGCAGDVTRLLHWKGNRARGSWLSDSVGMRGTNVACRNVNWLLAHLGLLVLVCHGTRWCLYRLRRLWVACHRCDHGEKLVLLLSWGCECVLGWLHLSLILGGSGVWLGLLPALWPWGHLQPHAGAGDQDVGAGVTAHLVGYPELRYKQATSQFFVFGCFLALVLTGRDQRLHGRASNKRGSWGWWFPFLTGQHSHRWGDWEAMWPHMSWNSRVVGVETSSARAGVFEQLRLSWCCGRLWSSKGETGLGGARLTVGLCSYRRFPTKTIPWSCP